MVRNTHGFIPKIYRPRPIGYRVEGHNQCAIFIDPQTKIHFEIRIIGDFIDNYRTGRYLELYKRVDGMDWENIEDFTSIRSAMEQLRKEMELAPESLQAESNVKFYDISKWTKEVKEL